jgi:hypothetical protein
MDECEQTIAGNVGCVKSASFSPDGEKVVSSSLGQDGPCMANASNRIIVMIDTPLLLLLSLLLVLLQVLLLQVLLLL